MKKFFLLAAAAVALTASAEDFYMIGTNVNGHKWATGEADCKFTNKGDGIYEWNGEFLGTGFKMNNGGWDNPDFNFGSNGENLVVGEAYWYGVGGTTGNIAFSDCTGIKNPKVVLDLNEGTIVVTGDKDGAYEWFFTGDFNDWNITDLKMTETEAGSGIFKIANVTLPEAGEFKVAQTGWASQYGSPEEAPAEITPDALSAVLGLVGPTNACPFTLEPGAYDVTWDLNETTVTFAPAGQDAVAGVAVENVAPVYYNLQGVKVANPNNGVFVKVVGNKATKVVVAE